MIFYHGKPTTGHSFISHGCLPFSTCQEECIGTKIDRWNPCPRMDQFSHGTLSFSFSARTLPCRKSRNESLPWQTMWYCAQMLCDGWTHNRATLGKQGPRCCCLYFFWVPRWHFCPLLLDTFSVFLNSQLSLPTVFPRASLFCSHRCGRTSSCLPASWELQHLPEPSVAPYSPAASQHPWAAPPPCALSLQSQPCLSSLTPGTTSAWETGPRHLRRPLPLCRFEEAPFFFFFFTDC